MTSIITPSAEEVEGVHPGAKPSPTPQEARSQDNAPPRPKAWHPEVVRPVAEALAADVAAWGDMEVDERLIDVLASALRGDSDGYRIARELESRLYISPDAELVEILDRADTWGAEHRAVAAWVKLTGATVPLPVGTMVSFPRGVGEITGRDEAQATYTVWTLECRSEKRPGNGFVIAAEDCTPTPPENGAADGASTASTLGNSGRNK